MSFLNMQFTKKLGVALAIAALCFMNARACDVCGCGAGNIYIGFFPNEGKHHIGLRYRSLPFRSHLSDNSPYADLFRTNEQFELLDIMAQFRIHRRWQASFILPFVWARQKSHERELYTNGLADALFQVQFLAWDTDRKHPEKDWKQQLWLGIGTKLPIGRWRLDPQNQSQVYNPNFQPGTGSWDGLLTNQYALRFKNWVLWEDTQFRINGVNEQGYRFGSRVSGNLNLMRHFIAGNFRIMPFIGWYAEYSKVNLRDEVEVPFTGGYLQMLNAGFSAYIKAYSLLLQWQEPMVQNLGDRNYAAGSRIMVQAAISL